MDAFLYKNGTTSQQIKTGVGQVAGIIVNSHSSGTFRLNDGLSGTTSAGVKATGVLTGSGVFTNGETITIGDKVYTMVSALTGEPNEVLIGANLATSLDNLKEAINAGTGEGTVYGTGTQANPNVVATTNTDTAQTVEAYRIGTYGNSIVTTETCANASFGAATLTSGANASILITNTYTVPAGSQSILFAKPINFDDGLFITIGGTIDYTVIYN